MNINAPANLTAGRQRKGLLTPRAATRQRAKHLGLWILQSLLAVTFILAGGQKLIGLSMMVASFDRLGFGNWFRYLIGGIEVVCGMLLLKPRVVSIAAALLVCIMMGATLAQLTKLGGSPLAPIVLGLLCMLVAWGRIGWLRK